MSDTPPRAELRPCPVCGWPIKVHRPWPGSPTHKLNQELLARMAAVGLPRKIIGQVLGVGVHAVNARLNKLRDQHGLYLR